jgi:hypothetical protein
MIKICVAFKFTGAILFLNYIQKKLIYRKNDHINAFTHELGTPINILYKT